MTTPTTEQKKRLLKAKIAVALHDELGRVPKADEIDQVFLLGAEGPSARKRTLAYWTQCQGSG